METNTQSESVVTQVLENLSREELLSREAEQQAELDRLQNVLNEKSKEEKYEEHCRAVRPTVLKILEQCGLSDVGSREVVRLLGKYTVFQVDEHGCIVMDVGGVMRPAAEVLPVHPLVQTIISRGGIGVAGEMQRVDAEIAQQEREVADAKAIAARYPADNSAVLRFSRERKKLDELLQRRRELEPKPVQTKKVADPALLMRLRAAEAEYKAKKAAAMQNPGNNSLVIAASAAGKIVQQLRQQIDS